MRKISLLSAAVALFAISVGSAHADIYTYVGSWRVDQATVADPDTGNWSYAFTGQQAAAYLFGGAASNYVTSTNGSNVEDINFSAWVSHWGGQCNGVPDRDRTRDRRRKPDNPGTASGRSTAGRPRPSSGACACPPTPAKAGWRTMRPIRLRAVLVRAIGQAADDMRPSRWGRPAGFAAASRAEFPDQCQAVADVIRQMGIGMTTTHGVPPIPGCGATRDFARCVSFSAMWGGMMASR